MQQNDKTRLKTIKMVNIVKYIFYKTNIYKVKSRDSYLEKLSQH